MKFIQFIALCSILNLSCKQRTGNSNAKSISTTTENSLSYAELINRASASDRIWPGTSWIKSDDFSDGTSKSDSCTELTNFLFPNSKTKDSLRSDGAMIVKKGKVVYQKMGEHYALRSPSTDLHPVWSSTKSFTAILFGAISELSKQGSSLGVKATDGSDLSLATKLNQIYTPQELASFNSDPAVGEITMGHLLEMSPGFNWNGEENYEEDVTNSDIIRMLWREPHLGDMNKYALASSLNKNGPGNTFTYSSANTVIVMAALKKLYGDRYPSMPWDVLFNKINLQKVVFETDRSGTFIGSSYLHTTLEDMARFGYLLVNAGQFQNEKILSEDFYNKIGTLSSGMASPLTPEKKIVDEGGFYSLGFWINPKPSDLSKARVRTFTSSQLSQTQFLPNAPKDLIFTAGHYGQIIFIFPTEDLVFARYGFDKEYFSKLDQMAKLVQICAKEKNESP